MINGFKETRAKKIGGYMKRSSFDVSRLNAAKELKVNDNFIPCPTKEGDELYPNGIFVFNITKMIEYIKKNSSEIDFVKEILPLDTISVFAWGPKNQSRP
jgi:hypothetical protein